MRAFVMVILVMIFSSCVEKKNSVNIQNQASFNANFFKVKEVFQTSNYTYLYVDENITERWVAVNKQDINVGDIYYYDGALKMTDFKSKELNRTFKEIFFISKISKTPAVHKEMEGGIPAHSGKVETKKRSSVNVGKTVGEITLADIFTRRVELGAKEIEIRGVVVKVNKQVMGKNWIHIQDGTDFNGQFDLTITSQDLAEMGDEVTFKGKLSVNKDFGSGYRYDVILEDAVLKSKKTRNK